MGRSVTPTYRIEYTAKNYSGTSMVGWQKHNGRATSKNLARYCDAMNGSFESGGCNEHISKSLGYTAKITGARLVHQFSGDVIATWAA